jgi:exodeoxyribonuclease-3
MRIATWNVNSIRSRLDRVMPWLDQHAPDVLCMQETKCTDDVFPREGFEARGYHLAVLGQKTYNGVAIASRLPLTGVESGLPWPGDEAARGISAEVGGVRVVDLYVPNGSEVGSEKYAYKLAWLDRLRGWLDESRSPDEPLVLCGDFNIAPEDRDVYDPAEWRDQVLCTAAERERFQALLDWGLHDVWRRLHEEETGRYTYTWWDFRGLKFQKGEGLRIDLLLATSPVLARARGAAIERTARKGKNPSDHAPVLVDLDA